MITILRELQIPLILIGVMIGYQLSIYFFYQYFRYKKENIRLNKILVAYGLFFLLGLNGILLRNINLYFISDSTLFELFFKITSLLMSLTIFIFIAIISSESFSIILNSKISRVFGIISFISIPPIFLFEHNSLELNLLTIPAIFGILYIWYFQIKLIQKSEKTIRLRLILILIGMFVLMSGFLVRGEFARTFFLQENEANIIIFTSISSIFSLFVLFLGVYKFPAFLELDWKKNLVQLIIIDQQTKNRIYSNDFSDLGQLKRKNILDNSEKGHVLSKGLIGINNIINSITHNREKESNRIHYGDFYFLYQIGEGAFSLLTFILITNEENPSLTYFLKKVRKNFQDFYSEVIDDINKIEGKEEAFFSSFNPILINLAINK